ncbi:MAG: HSP90 family protein [Propionibacteriaceae bacterium]|nr:HSP90 family protein [Propionibacteriaceae bacterium]
MSDVTPEAKPFQVDLRGVVDLLSRHIYSSEKVFLREVLQNGVDAITARRESFAADEEPSRPWGIHIAPMNETRREFVITDEGIGLDIDEVSELLATVGRSSKRDIFDIPRSDYLGQFGIGLLSCFMVAEDIRIISRSAKGGAAVEWIGNQNGTFTVRELGIEMPIGTQLFLTPRFDTGEFLETAMVTRLAGEYGEFLPVRVEVATPNGTEIINKEAVFLQDIPGHVDELVAYSQEVIGTRPFDIIDICAPGTNTRGKAFVLPFAPPPTSQQATRVYLGRMLLSKNAPEILPPWAFFVRAVVNSADLSPTASREAIVEDFRLEYTRTQLGDAIRRWLIELTVSDEHRLRAFLAIHEVSLKQLVLHDDELAQFITKWLTVETTLGRMRVERLVGEYENVRFTQTVDEFRQIASIAREDAPIVNGGYIYDSELVQLLPTLFDQVTVERVDVVGELDRLDPPPLDDRAVVVALENRAGEVLKSRECQAVVRIMEQPDMPALYVADPEVFRHIDRGRAREAVGEGLWSDLLGKVDEFAKTITPGGADEATARLCLNWGNPVIRTLAKLEDETVFSRCVSLLYVQSQLAGHRPLSSPDRSLMTTALADLIALSVGLEKL